MSSASFKEGSRSALANGSLGSLSVRFWRVRSKLLEPQSVEALGPEASGFRAILEGGSGLRVIRSGLLMG